MPREKQISLPIRAAEGFKPAAKQPVVESVRAGRTTRSDYIADQWGQVQFNLRDSWKCPVRQNRCPEHGHLPILCKEAYDQWYMFCGVTGCERRTPVVPTSQQAIAHWNMACLLET